MARPPDGPRDGTVTLFGVGLLLVVAAIFLALVALIDYVRSGRADSERRNRP